jgi:hypothetical protein
MIGLRRAQRQEADCYAAKEDFRNLFIEGLDNPQI